MNRMTAGLAAALSTAAVLAAGASAAQAGLTERLSSNRASVEITSEPAGTASIGVAVMSDLSGAGIKYLRIPASQTTYTPPAATPVVDLVANDSNYQPLGGWAGRLQTTPGGVTPSSIDDRLSADRTSVEVTAVPAGTASIEVAVMSNLSGVGVKYLRIPANQTSYRPPAGTPVVDLIAEDSSSNALGGWAGRLQTAQAEVVPPPPSSMVVSLNAGGWGVSNETSDLKGVVPVLRIDTVTGSEAAAYAAGGMKIIDDIHGPYNTAGIRALDARSWGSEAIARAKANSNIIAVELLNEPQNPYFWGSSAQGWANVEAYAAFVNTVAGMFAEAYPSGNGPKLLVSADGGFAGVQSWGAPLWAKLNQTARALAHPTVHPYGGTGERASSGLGNRARVSEAHALTSRSVWVTEVGWPTAVGQPPTGDSLQWTEAEQAANVASFTRWSRSLGYVEDVTLFQYRDYASNNFYGIETHAGARKQSYTTLQGLSHE
jgi:hypothetical protein